MPPKPEATPPAAAAKDAAAPAAAPAPEASGGKSLMGTLIPVVLVVVLAPVASWAVAQFVIIPQMEKKLTAAVGGAAPGGDKVPMMIEPEKGGGGGGGHGGSSKKGEGGPSNTYEFNNVVVNLSGTMGTRYLKTSFLVTSKDPSLREVFVGNKPKMVDITLNVLSSLSLADLEEAGAKNIIRERLINAYNQAFGKKIAEQIYFSDFVVQ